MLCKYSYLNMNFTTFSCVTGERWVGAQEEIDCRAITKDKK
jgi:hypothetical protein